MRMSIRILALVSRTRDCRRRPLGPINASVLLDEWASSSIYLSTGVDGVHECWNGPEGEQIAVCVTCGKSHPARGMIPAKGRAGS
jgi:hypothetical protein